MRVLVTGALGGVGATIATHLDQAGHILTLTDRRMPANEETRGHRFACADLTDFGQATWLCEGQDAVVHAAAIPDPTQHPPDVVFSNNVLSTFNIVEGAKRSATTRRLVYISSETVLGFHYGENSTCPTQLPIDETTPTRPNDAYGLSKLMGERILEAAASTGRLTGVSLRPSWVQYEHTYQSELGPIVDDPAVATSGLWCYTDGNDLADAVARSLDARIDLHEAFFIVNPDSIGGHDVKALGRKLLNIDFSGAVMGPGRSAISSAKAEGVLGWRASRSWSDFVSPR